MKNIYVGNLPFTTSEAELKQTFESYGSVSRVNMVMDRDTGRPRGFAFVEMSNAAEGDAAIAGLNGTQLGQRALTVNEARPREPRGGGGRRDRY